MTEGSAWVTGGNVGVDLFVLHSDHRTPTMTATWPFACTERRQPQLGVRRPGVALLFPTRHKAGVYPLVGDLLGAAST